MKLNISYPPTGCQKCIEVDDDKKLHALYDKSMAQEIAGDALGFPGYVFKITGGNDKQGFPMKQGIKTNERVRLLMGPNSKTYRPRRSGERKRKSVRGCIVASDIAVVHLVIVKKGDEELPGITDNYIPRRLGPKRASKIRKLFNLTKQDDVRKYVIRREIPPKEGKKKRKSKAPKIQRLVTPVVLQRKRHRLALKKRRAAKAKTEAAEYAKLLAQRSKEAREKRQQSLSKRRSVSKSGTSTATTATTATTAKPTTTATTTSKQTTTAKPTTTTTATTTKGSTTKATTTTAAKPTTTSTTSSKTPTKTTAAPQQKKK